MDSFMYQTVGHHAIDLYAEAIGLPLYRRTIQGGSIATDKDYTVTTDDEVEDLYQLLLEVKEEHGIEAVSVGAVLSDYQRVRVENVCQRLGLTSLGYLWRRNQAELLNEMIQCGVEAILIKVASLGLSPKKHLGKSLEEMQGELMYMHDKYELNVCGEGGEYETFTLDCPLFNKKIVLDSIETVMHSDDAFAPVGYLNLIKAHLEDKEIDQSLSFKERLAHLPMKRSSDITFIKSSDEFAPCLLFYSLANVDFSCKTQKISDDIEPQIKQKNDDVWISGIVGKYSGNESLRDITLTAMEQLKCMITLDLNSYRNNNDT
ncbi:hypothetical protein FSP39_000323 [Pinctada imbricata]|uniref:Diphthine--ammonia ligase n=1 Tax=Pinctada imbricata TaxID=66713 RepID=A0AA88Y1U6_PINIB|nr:hypothetical protein FSP39_000323 [Pinctada imbricata]